MQADNPQLERLLPKKAAKVAIKTLPANATGAQVREVLNALIYLLFHDDPDVPTNASHLPKAAADEVAKVSQR